MATDEFSSLNDVTDNDIFSRLPDHIIHCILGFLPSVKDMVRTSAVSKSWHQGWLTFPIPQFNLQDFDYRHSSDSKQRQFIREQFIGFVDKTLQRFGRQNEDRMKIFNLSTYNSMAPLITSWIGMALDNKVEHLALDIIHYNYLLCFIPDRILSAYWLKSLKLVGTAICIQSLNENCHVNLPSLTSLHIQDTNRIKGDQLQKLLSGCPALEDIALLSCDSQSTLDIFENPNLETLEFSVKDNNIADPHPAIRVRAPKLKSFGYSSQGWSLCDIDVTIYNSPELKSLRIWDRYKTDEWFDKFITPFPQLENLTIEHCYALRKIRISNPILEKINIRHCDNLVDMVISSKKLTSLSLSTQHSSIPNPSIWMEMANPPNDCIANISNPGNVSCSRLMDTSWYCKLKEFLTRPFAFKSLIVEMIAIYARDGDMNGKDVQKRLPHAALNIEKLSLRLIAPSSCHPHILNGLLSTCHPTTIELNVTSDNSFGKLVCEELGKGENNTKCWCKDYFKCWKHQLKEVKIEKIKGINLADDLNWDTLFNLLPTLKEGNIIYFKLMW